MAEHTQQYIQMLHKIARTDATTGIGNKRGYLEKVAEIKENTNGKYDEYALVSMDLNMLKATNDTYGHETGDMLIRKAAGCITGIFTQSHVFRTGGDEFVAILVDDDYLKRSELLNEFEKSLNHQNPEMRQFILSISFGMAECPKDDTEYDRVFELADERMYQKKREMKDSLQDWRQ